MSFQQSARILSRAGVPMAMDVSSAELPNLKSRQDVENLLAEGIAEMDQFGYSVKYLQAQKAYALGLENTLPDLEIAGGGIARTLDETAGMLNDAQHSSQQYFATGSIDPLITRLGWQDLPVDEVRDRLSIALVDAPNHERPAIVQALAAVENSGKTQITSLSYEMPEEMMVVEANSTDDSLASDPYTRWRSNASGDHGLEGLAIKSSVAEGALWSGITDWSGSGGTYEFSSDWALAQSMAASNESGGGSDDD